MDIGVITNPNSRKNRGKQGRALALQRIVGDRGQVHETRSPDEIKPVLREFLRNDVRYWVADGGDGALHCMLRDACEVLEEPEFADRELPMTLPTNGGTIDFVAKSAGVRGNAEQLLDRLCEALEQHELIALTDVEAMRVTGVRRTPAGDEPFQTVGFAAAVGGVGQRFFAKYYASPDPRPSDIVKVVSRTVGSLWLGKSLLAGLLSPELRDYAQQMFEPTRAQITVDGHLDRRDAFTGIHVASMPINLGNVFRFFTQAMPGQLHAIYGTPAPAEVVLNLPRLHLGKPMQAKGTYDGPCKEMRVRAVGDELLAPVIDGEYYKDVVEVSFSLGPRLQIPRVVGRLYA